MSNTPNILAVDPSLTCMGWAGGGASGTIEPPKMLRGVERLRWWREALLRLVRETDAHVIVIEGYSFLSRGRAVVSLGELGGVLRVALVDAAIKYAEVPPSALKKYATGKGNAPKGAMLAAAIRRLGYERDSHDEADALWLLHMALDHYGSPTVQMPAAHRKALESVSWPVLAVLELQQPGRDDHGDGGDE